MNPARIPVVHHPSYVAPGQPRSGYPWNKNGAIRDLLHASGAIIEWHRPEPMPQYWLEAVHDADYVAEVLERRVPREKERRIGFAVTEAVAVRAPLVPAGTWLAAHLALRHGYAANSAGGSHHALAGTGAGYCVFNDLAIAANRLVEEGTVERLAIVDVDVHQGDGTAALTAGHPGIVTYSIHAEKNFPVRKARSTLDVPLADGTGDSAYLETLERTLAPFLDEHRPELILYQAGVDPFAGDRLGRLDVSEEGLVTRERLVARLAIERGIPLASTVGGGYGDDVLAIARRHVRAILTLGETFSLGTGERPLCRHDRGAEPMLMLAALLAGATPACTSAQLSVSTGGNPGDFNGMSHSGTLLVVRNRSRHACTLPGLPQLSFRDAAGYILPIVRKAPLGMHPGPVVLPIRLAPGAVANTALRWVSGPVYDNSRCYRVASIALAGRQLPLVVQICGETGKPAGIDQSPLRSGTSPS